MTGKKWGTDLPKWGSLGLVLLVGIGLGWGLRGSRTVQAVQRVDPLVGILQQALARVSAHDVAVTDSARVALDSFRNYRTRYVQLLTLEQQAETVYVRTVRDTSSTTAQVAIACSVVLLACQHRAALADQEAQQLRDRLASVVQLRPKRWSLGVYVGPGYDWQAKRVAWLAVGLGLSYRVR